MEDFSFFSFSHLSTCCGAQGARKGAAEIVSPSVMIWAQHGAALRGNMRIKTNVHVLLNLIYSFFYSLHFLLSILCFTFSTTLYLVVDFFLKCLRFEKVRSSGTASDGRLNGQ